MKSILKGIVAAAVIWSIRQGPFVRNCNQWVPLYNISKTFVGATGPAYLIKLRILLVPKYASQNFVVARHQWHPF